VSPGWHGRAALITGASSGIGAALARALAARGATVGLVARRQDRLAEVLADCRAPSNAAARGAAGAASTMWVEDLADPDAPDRLAAAALRAWGRVDVVVNNAATPGVRDATRLDGAEVERVMQVNFHAPVRLTLALLPSMLERGAGTIVNVSSLGGRLGIPREAAYCASKFALCGWSESLALDLWHTPVRVRLIVPGAVDTEIWDRPGEEPSTYDGPKVPAVEVAEGIADAVDAEGFEHYLPDMSEVVRFKTASIDDFFAGSIAYLTPDA
jgi:short-subunit dehydrogenase